MISADNHWDIAVSEIPQIGFSLAGVQQLMEFRAVDVVVT